LHVLERRWSKLIICGRVGAASPNPLGLWLTGEEAGARDVPHVDESGDAAVTKINMAYDLICWFLRLVVGRMLDVVSIYEGMCNRFHP
jgi:hypothetical protein